MKPSFVRALIAVLIGAGVLLLPALYNGYPLTWWDSRAYIEHAFSLMPRPDRVIGYSLWIRGLSFLGTLWTVAVAQCVLTSALVYRLVRAVSGRDAALRHVVLVVALTVFTSMPWVAALVLADVFTPLLVVALYVLTFHVTGRLERALLLAFVALCTAVHLTHLWIGVLLLGTALVLRRRSFLAVVAPGAALVAGILFVLCFNVARTGQASLASGTDAFLLGHLEESGIASRLLNAHCPDRDYLLCPYKDRLPMPVDAFLWNDKLDILPWEHKDAIKKEARRMLHDSIAEYPELHVAVAADYSARNFFAFETGGGFDGDSAESVAVAIDANFPADSRAYAAAKQQRGVLPIAALRALHTPVAYALLALNLVLVGRSLWRERPWPSVESTRLVVFGFVAYTVNAVLCGNLSGVLDRFGARVLWLLALGPFVLGCEWLDRRSAGKGAGKLVV